MYKKFSLPMFWKSPEVHPLFHLLAPLLRKCLPNYAILGKSTVESKGNNKGCGILCCLNQTFKPYANVKGDKLP